MKNSCFILLFLVVTLTSCKKEDKPVYSGIITIDNVLNGTGPYYAMGFSVPTGTLVSTLNNPLDLITILVDFDTAYVVRKLYFSTSNFKNSFALYGTYGSEADAKQAFDDLTSFTIPSLSELADDVKPHQLWLYKTSSGKYAKIRIISTFTEKRDNNNFPYAECTFEWVYQPDGSTTFPEK